MAFNQVNTLLIYITDYNIEHICYCSLYSVVGANLEVANHVIIVHPYCPPHIQSVSSVPLAQAQAFEQQAIGRVLRFPQNKNVFLYR